MIARILFLVLLALPSFADEYRGYFAINRTIKERLIRSGAEFELGAFLGQHYQPGEANLLDLMGTYKTGGFGGSGFHNGNPNSLNMLLWHLALSGLARDASLICTDEQTVDYNDDFLMLVKELCAWPKGASDSRLAAFWQVLMGYDAPPEEFTAWKEFLPSLNQSSGPEAVEWMTYTVLANPFFLLKH